MKRALLSVGGVLLDVVPVVVVGCAVFLLIRSQLLEYYQIPTSSMEPTLHGDRRTGDLVLVDKTAWWGRTPAPFDLVVVRSEHANANHVVKRLACIAPPDGTRALRIERGDLFVGEPSSQLARVVKDPIAHRDLRIAVFRHPGLCEQSLPEFLHLPPENATFEAGTLHVASAAESVEGLQGRLTPAARKAEPGELSATIAGFVRTNKAVDTSYLDPSGRRRWEAKNYYPDIGIELGLLAGRLPEAIVFVLEFHDRDHIVAWQPRQHLVETITADGVSSFRRIPGIESPRELSFGYLDGRLFLVADDVPLLLTGLTLDEDRNYRRPNRLHFGIVGGSIAIDRVRVFRDLSYSTILGAHAVGSGVYTFEPGHMFLLGDNTNDSSDSREALGMVRVDRLVGRPFAILAPGNRTRIFER